MTREDDAKEAMRNGRQARGNGVPDTNGPGGADEWDWQFGWRCEDRWIAGGGAEGERRRQAELREARATSVAVHQASGFFNMISGRVKT